MKEYLAKIISNAYPKIKITDIAIELTNIPGYDFTSNVALKFAKINKVNSYDLAIKIIEKIDLVKNHLLKIDVARPGFINISVNSDFICQFLNTIIDVKQTKIKQPVVIDYSSPNTAKKMHVGHLRSTVIGDSLKKIYQKFGFKVIGDNHIGDWGTQFGKLIVGYHKWLDNDQYQKDPIAELQRIYVMFGKKETPKLLVEARHELVKLQKKESQNYQLWQEFVIKSLAEYNKIYKLLNITFDYCYGESFYNEMMEPLVNELINKGIAQKDQGAKIVYFDKKLKLSPCLIEKKDGGFLYSTSDLATVKYRLITWKPHMVLYVVDNRQKMHFKQVFALANLLGIKENLVHIDFGIMASLDGNFATRKGNVIDLEKLLTIGYQKALVVVQEKNPNLSIIEQKKIATTVSVGAIKYFDLSHHRSSDIKFSWTKALNFSGNSAPYLQYTYTRINSLIKKSGLIINSNNVITNGKIEKEIVKNLYQYGKILMITLSKNEPHHIGAYLFKLASLFNSWYSQVNFLKDQKNLNSRLLIASKVQIVLKDGLGLLGINTLEKM